MSRHDTTARIHEKATGILGLGEFQRSMGADLLCYDMCVENDGIIVKYLANFIIYNVDDWYGFIDWADDVPTLGLFSNRSWEFYSA